MRYVATHILTVLVLGLVADASGAARARVYAKVDAETRIYPGQDFTYSVVVEGGAKPTRIDVSALAPFNPRRAGSGTSMQTVGDRTTISYSENYAITAGEPGKMVLPGVTVVVGGQTVTTNPVEVTVSQPGSTDRLTLEFSLSEQRCYVGQPVIMTVRWVITARVQDADFTVPVFRSGDFFVEDVSESAGAYARERVTIDGVPVTVVENRQLIKGMEAAVISFSKVLIPKRAGRLVLDPVGVSTHMAVGRVRTGDFFNPYRMKYERVLVTSDPVTLEVLPVPEAGRPKQFYGLVGRYTISASATPTQVNVGDPITLTIRIGGNRYLQPVQWPALEQVPGLADNFKIPTEKASPVIEDGQKTFTQTIRANNDRVTEIPPVALAYFDPDAGAYAVAETDAIELDVAPTKVLTNADVEGTALAPGNREVEAIRKGLSANYYGPDVLANQRFSPVSALVSPGYAALWSIPLLGLVASSVVRFACRTSPAAEARKRRRQAHSIATRQLRNVHQADPEERHNMLASALRQYIGDRFDRVAASLTAEECCDIIAASTGDTQVAARYKKMIAACETARYGSMDADVGKKHVQDAIDLVHAVETRSPK